MPYIAGKSLYKGRMWALVSKHGDILREACSSQMMLFKTKRAAEAYMCGRRHESVYMPQQVIVSWNEAMRVFPVVR